MSKELKEVIDEKLKYYKRRLAILDQNSSICKCTQSRIQLLEELKEV
jgi:hypothetical protein